MKKLVLVMVFVLLTAVFIALNYLLWDRESREKDLKTLENMNASNNASMSAQNSQIDRLEKEVGELGNKITQLENEKNQLISEKKFLQEQKTKSDTSLQEKVNFINIIKQYADIKALSEPLSKWADALNQGKYEEAYELEYAMVPAADRSVSLPVYQDEMRKTIRKIEINEVKIDNLRGSGDGEIILDVRLTVKLAENAVENNPRFSDGLNEKYIKIGYLSDKKSFEIISISNY